MANMLSTTERAVGAEPSQFRKIPEGFKFVVMLLAWYILLWTILPYITEMGTIARTLIGASLMLIGFLLIEKIPTRSDGIQRLAFKLVFLIAFTLLSIGIIMVGMIIEDITGVPQSPL
jgi:hypothetical protein